MVSKGADNTKIEFTKAGNAPQISVIMPVYNTGEILKDTIQSVLHQTFRNFELILVDDGSTDGSGEVCDSFAEVDSRVVVIHKKNGGICEARNAGIDRAVGAYITFCDHDDLYLPTLLQTELETAYAANADMVVVGKTMDENGARTNYGYRFQYNRAEIREHVLEILESTALYCIWNILYRRELFQKLRFNTEYKRGHEDFSFNLEILTHVNTICAIEEPLYVHIVRGNLSTSAKVYREAVPAMVDTCNKAFDVIQASGIDMESQKAEIVRFHSGQLRSCLAYAVKAGLGYQEFVRLVDSLQFLPEKNSSRICGVGFRTKLTYLLLSRRWLRALYLVMSVHRMLVGT